MNSPQCRSLRQLAKAAGVQVSYKTIAGEEQTASPESLRGVLTALGVEASSDASIASALEVVQQRHWEQCIDPVVTCWEGRPMTVSLRLWKAWKPSQVHCSLLREDGSETAFPGLGQVLKGAGEVAVCGRIYRQGQLQLPALELGYHRLRLETPAGRAESLVIAAPTRSYSEPGLPKRWGVFLPLYALHSSRSWGAGDLRDWLQLSDWTAQLGGSVVASLPLLSAFMGCPVCEASPYSPASRLFWNEFYLDIEAIPEFNSSARARRLVRSAKFQRELSAFRRNPLIDYPRQMEARRRVLQCLSECFFDQNSPRLRAFKAFLRARPEVEEYARFRAVCDRNGRSWQTWEERQRNGQLRSGDYDEAVVRYYAYVQWLAQEQMTAAVTHCRERGVQFYLDLPLGVHPDGYDSWRHRDVFALQASVGAPPDPFFSKGQDWGFAPLHPNRIREQQYRYVLEYLRFQMRHTGLLRIDHVMGLHRLYWVPHGLSPREGAYVNYRADELYALLCLESHRHRTTLVGENLGTVPPPVNAGMKRHHLRGMFVVQYEQQPDPRAALRPPPRQCVAGLNTHDMPTFASHWRGLDITDRADLGLIPKGDLGRERRQRRELNLALRRFLSAHERLGKVSTTAQGALHACLRWLSQSDAEVVLVNLEDLWLEEAPQNTPGTCHERPNWRRKARFRVEDLQSDASVQKLLRELDALRH